MPGLTEDTMKYSLPSLDSHYLPSKLGLPMHIKARVSTDLDEISGTDKSLPSAKMLCVPSNRVTASPKTLHGIATVDTFVVECWTINLQLKSTQANQPRCLVPRN